jgi:hypothetical protein
MFKDGRKEDGISMELSQNYLRLGISGAESSGSVTSFNCTEQRDVQTTN